MYKSIPCYFICIGLLRIILRMYPSLQIILKAKASTLVLQENAKYFVFFLFLDFASNTFAVQG